MYKRILVPVDGSPPSNRGLAEAVKLAALAGASLRLLHVINEIPAATGMPGFGEANIDVMQLLKEGGAKVLADARAVVEAAHIPVDTVLVESFSGRLSDHVVAQAREWGAEIVVLGSHGRRGMGRMVLGSDAEQIIRFSDVPVLVVRAPASAE